MSATVPGCDWHTPASLAALRRTIEDTEHAISGCQTIDASAPGAMGNGPATHARRCLAEALRELRGDLPTVEVVS